MKIEKQELAGKLNKLKSILPARPGVECLKGILFKNNSLFANNLEMAMMTPLDIDTEEEFILPQKAVEMIESLPAGEVEITSDESHSITIKMDNIKNRFQSFNPSEYPDINMNVNTGAEDATVPGEILQEAMNSILYAVANNDGKPSISGMLLESEKGSLNLVATDGFRLAWAVVDYEKDLKMIIPRAALQKLLQFGLKGNVEIKYNYKNAMFKLDEYTFYSRLIEGSFIDYKKIIPAYTNSVVIDRHALIDSINRSSICADDKGKPQAVLDIYGDMVKISTKSAFGEYVEALRLEGEIDTPIKIGFNARFLLDCLKSYKCPNIELSFGDSIKPMVAVDGQLKSIVLPVRLKG